jgi:hypothetical protein
MCPNENMVVLLSTFAIADNFALVEKQWGTPYPFSKRNLTERRRAALPASCYLFP